MRDIERLSELFTGKRILLWDKSNYLFYVIKVILVDCIWNDIHTENGVLSVGEYLEFREFNDKAHFTWEEIIAINGTRKLFQFPEVVYVNGGRLGLMPNLFFSADIKGLCLNNCDDIEGVQRMPNLISLIISRSKGISSHLDGRLAEISSIEKLMSLYLYRVFDGFSGLEFKSAKICKHIALIENKHMTDRDLEFLSEFSALKALSVNRSPLLKGEFLKFISASNIEYLDLSQCHGIDDDKIEFVLSMQSLKVLFLMPKVSLASIKKLKSANPLCKINGHYFESLK